MCTLNRLFAESDGLADYAGRYASYLADLIARLDCAAVERVGRYSNKHGRPIVRFSLWVTAGARPQPRILPTT